MRWFPTLLFSNSHSHSSSSSSSTSSSSSSSSSSATLKSSPSTSSFPDPRKNTRSAWFFGSGKRSTRSRMFRHVSDLDAVVVPLSRSSSAFDHSSTSSVEPQPLPLPRDADYRFPSPKDAADTPVAAVDVTLTAGFRMRSVFESQDTRKNMEHVVPQDASGGASASTQGDNLWAGVPARSAPTSPFASPRLSPKNTKSDDFVPYYYMAPKGNQFWSAPEMPLSDPSPSAGHPPPAFYDLSALRIADNALSPHQSPRGKSPTQHPKSPTGPSSSSIPRRLSLDTSTARRETLTVHPLPLPPWAGPVAPLPSPSATFSQPKTESLPMKNQWQKGKLIGRGTFGTVYVATNRKTGALCAMKEAEIFSDDPKSAECIKQLEQEIKVLSQLKHPNIVQYYGSEIVEDRFYIYLEYVHPGSMNKYVREHCGAITECVVRSFTRHILSGLAYLHGKKTIHRDIKGANLLVDSAGVVKLADFGMAKHLTGHVTDLSLKGSPYWMAPELLQAVVQKDNSSDLAFAVDIWSLGCTIIEMFTGKPPWSEYEGAAAMFKVMRDTPPIPEALSAEGKDFLRLCFIRNPAERPTASMLLDHRFLKNLQQPDVSSSTQLYNGTILMDTYSPRELSENKPDQISIPSAQIAKGKLATERFFPGVIIEAPVSNKLVHYEVYSMGI
ncbi:Mitogen-activated protein kinase kinase kinase YODA [Spatholobus suberectus]|nr:Mitogen-activated protein kinase kinase kinase YODA [Spatholobus suberectus]